MNLFRMLPALAAASFAFAFAAQSHAYCQTHTCDPKKGSCDTVDFCNVGGKALFWASSTVTWSVQKDGSLKEGITADQLDTVVTKAFKTWQAADCGNGQTPSIKLLDRGFVECAKPEYNTSQPNQNVITFHDSAWPYEEAGAETLALTTVFFNGETGEIYDANVEINSNQTTFVIDDNARLPEVDLNAVLTHELGHFLGLSHSTDTQATMYSMYEIGMTTLDKDDVAGICASLPPGRATKDSDEPRHGFSTECGSPESGCCSSTIGGQAPPGHALALWAFGLGLCAFGARGRLRRSRSARALPR